MDRIELIDAVEKIPAETKCLLMKNIHLSISVKLTRRVDQLVVEHSVFFRPTWINTVKIKISVLLFMRYITNLQTKGIIKETTQKAVIRQLWKNINA